MDYTISIKRSAQQELERLPRNDRQRVEGKILSLAKIPRPNGVVALKGKRFQGLHRIRSGDYRIIYQINEKPSSVLVLKIGDRKDVYD